MVPGLPQRRGYNYEPRPLNQSIFFGHPVLFQGLNISTGLDSIFILFLMLSEVLPVKCADRALQSAQLFIFILFMTRASND